MTRREAECFHALRQWQRCYIRRKLRRALLPRPRFIELFVTANALAKCAIIMFAIVLSPVMIVLWLLGVLRALVIFPVAYFASHLKPRNIRAPGERNIKGVHYQFARHINLPPDLYIKCVDDWVNILYGSDKLPEYSLTNYLDADYIVRRQVAYEEDASLQKIIRSQISNAREELSKELGNY